MQIGELSDRTGVPRKTIRYYEEIGVMPPPSRSEGGYRQYAGDAAARLGFVRAAQSVGLTLAEIREVLAFRDRGEIPCRRVAALIDEHAANLAERIVALQAMHRDLERLARRARTATPAGSAESRFCPIIEPEGGPRTPLAAPASDGSLSSRLSAAPPRR